MTQSRLVLHAMFVAVAVALSSATAAGQGWEEAFNRLKAEVDQLREENQALRGEIEGMVGGEDGLAAQIGKIQADLGALNPGQNLWGGKVLRVGGSGFADAVIWGGEWRTRADYRFNASDLLDDVDDAGFRLDYRFNLGLGFVWGLRDGVEDGGNETRIKTWFEIQSAGRAANNTAESIASFQGASIGDFAARDNDLDFVRLYQAYILVENLLHIDGLQLKIGRQELKYGSKLIMGTNEFYTGTVHDAVRLDLPLPFLGDNASASVFYAKEAASDGQFPPGITTGSLLSAQFRASGDEDELFGLYVSDMEPLDGIALDFYYIYFNARSGNGVNVPNNITSANDPLIDAFGRATLGGRINTLGLWLRSDELVDNEGTLYTSIESAIQLGSSENDRDLTAWIIEVLVDWRLPFNTGDLKELRIHGGYYFAEGADAANDAGFSPLFISRHDNQPVHGRYGAPSRFGNLDLIPQTNVHVFHAGLKYNDFESKWTVGLAYYYAVRQHTTGLDDPLTISLLGNIYTDQRQFGHEFDLYAVKQLSTQIELFFNVSLFLPATDFIIQQSNGGSFQEVDTDPAFGAYAQIQVRF
ncbi:MAG: alginate export family protein [Planctomycetota bacterium]